MDWINVKTELPDVSKEGLVEVLIWPHISGYTTAYFGEDGLFKINGHTLRPTHWMFLPEFVEVEK